MSLNCSRQQQSTFAGGIKDYEQLAIELPRSLHQGRVRAMTDRNQCGVDPTIRPRYSR
jgi:hypothetical protein